MLQKVLRVSIHIIVWLLFIFSPLFFFDNNREMEMMFSESRLFTIGLMIVFFYLNYFLLISKLLLNKKTVFYVGAIVVSLTIVYGLNYLTADYFVKQFDEKVFSANPPGPDRKNEQMPPDFQRDYKGPPPPDKDFDRKDSMKRHMSFTATFSVFIALILGTIIRLTEEWYKTEKQKKEIASEKLLSELSFLKSQVSPHFLFNTLNGIYSLSLKKSDETPEAILKLSGLMRHMLYESENKNVLLDSEIEYLENYIELQKLRLTDKSNVKFSVSGNIKNKFIQPMLLIPFIENAFKHGHDSTGANIEIEIELKGLTLAMSVKNKVSESAVKDRSSGIGLENVQKRLSLLYPDAYTLEVIQKKGIHSVNLTLKLESA